MEENIRKGRFEKTISLLALFISLGSLLVSFRSCHLAAVANFSHVIPNLEISYLQDKDYDYINFRNNSPISIVSLSVDYKNYGYDIREGKYRTTSYNVKDYISGPGEDWIYQQELLPNASVRKFLVLDTSGKDPPPSEFITVRVFDVVFFRKSDLMKFEKKVIYFIDDGGVFTFNEALKMQKFRDSIKKLDGYINKNSLEYKNPKMDIKKYK